MADLLPEINGRTVPAVALGHVVQDVSKSGLGTKKRVAWRFAYGFSTDEVHTVVLTHSTLSGKKAVQADGREVYQSSAAEAGDVFIPFGVGRYRVVVLISATNIYDLFVNNVSFENLAPMSAGVFEERCRAASMHAEEDAVVVRPLDGFTKSPPKKPSSSGWDPFGAGGGAGAREDGPDVWSGSGAAEAGAGRASAAGGASTSHHRAEHHEHHGPSDSFDPFGSGGDKGGDKGGAHAEKAHGAAATKTATKTVSKTASKTSTGKPAVAPSSGGSAAASFDPFALASPSLADLDLSLPPVADDDDDEGAAGGFDPFGTERHAPAAASADLFAAGAGAAASKAPKAPTPRWERNAEGNLVNLDDILSDPHAASSATAAHPAAPDTSHMSLRDIQALKRSQHPPASAPPAFVPPASAPPAFAPPAFAPPAFAPAFAPPAYAPAAYAPPAGYYPPASAPVGRPLMPQSQPRPAAPPSSADPFSGMW